MWNFRETPLSIRAVSTEMVHEGLGTSPNSHGRGHTSPVHDLIRSSEPRFRVLSEPLTGRIWSRMGPV